MTITATTLRPGFLVSLKTSVRGNVRYTKRDIGTTKTKDGVVKVKWETERTTINPAEHEAAIKCRSKVRGLVTGVCISSEFGLLCPDVGQEELEQAITDARKEADAFNETAKLSRIRLYVIFGRIAQDDMEAVRSINSEVSELLKDMEDGVSNADVKTIREAANKAKSISEMLSAEAKAQTQIAIEAARKVARAIVKADGEDIAVDRRVISTIKESRKTFLDLDEQEEIATPKSKGRQVELAAE